MLAVCPSGTIKKNHIPSSLNAPASGYRTSTFGRLFSSCSVFSESRVPWSNVECFHSSFSPQGQINHRRNWMFCRSRNNSDEEYRSSRNIAISLLRRYRTVIERGQGETLKEFISAGVNAYALGCTDEDLRKELMAMKESGLEIDRMESYHGSTQTKSKILLSEVDECILWLSIVFITILCTPQPTIVRWSSTPSVSEEILSKWRGFCAVIANAYYIRGMAWLPVKTLQLEQMAVMGEAEEPSVVASRMRLVFSTLEVVSPQWPRV
ncbi:Orotidine 5'-phosphate decarboxylase [Hirschfeldia incana]|nr:Orotidine 5'-phosphate decarboxylase [Hirschfeldia incana]KAJ0258013.1 Orotidine 5'-phosphate decarboxylase [Hirschfeldia incana]KAJ0258014.1 Orotidine 5'-phosphate decarboxylase [Hirschfeldia incana]